MITNNFEKILRFLPNAVSMNAIDAGHDGIPIIDTNGNTIYFRPFSQYNSCLPIFTTFNFGGGSKSNTGWRFGTGTTPATKNDYWMENPITSGINLQGTSGDLILDGNIYKTQYRLTIRNISSGDITISEIGYVGQAYGSSAQRQTASQVGVLFMREVLNEPITIASSESIILNTYIETPIE